jgi:hypothetical protein
VGGLVGSYLEYTCVTAKQHRKLLAEYQYTKDNFQMTDAEMVEFGKKIPQFGEDMKRQEEMAAVHALRAYRLLANGNIEDAKATLLRPIDLYYSLYHEKGGDRDLLDAIATAGKEFPDIAAVIAKEK